MQHDYILKKLTLYLSLCNLPGGANFGTKGHNMKKLGRGPLSDATY